mmetsp:Transcript_75972/g.195732  ORF Transcript_75972/g.195732 Transcript_75972/m.195732 type:complete len:245 (+) Transcript_75972:2338-3072(+)
MCSGKPKSPGTSPSKVTSMPKDAGPRGFLSVWPPKSSSHRPFVSRLCGCAAASITTGTPSAATPLTIALSGGVGSLGFLYRSKFRKFLLLRRCTKMPLAETSRPRGECRRSAWIVVPSSLMNVRTVFSAEPVTVTSFAPAGAGSATTSPGGMTWRGKTGSISLRRIRTLPEAYVLSWRSKCGSASCLCLTLKLRPPPGSCDLVSATTFHKASSRCGRWIHFLNLRQKEPCSQVRNLERSTATAC